MAMASWLLSHLEVLHSSDCMRQDDHVPYGQTSAEDGQTRSHKECIVVKGSSIVLNLVEEVEGLPGHGRPGVGVDVLEAVPEVPWMSQSLGRQSA